MSHMEKQITVKQRGWRVETHDCGTCYVPGDVVDVEDFFACGIVLERGDDPDLFELLTKRLKDYVEGRDIAWVEVVEGYFGRWSAPGYLDCTEWQFGKTQREISEEL